MKKYMPLEGLRWSRDSGSALCDTSQNSRSRTGWGGNFVVSTKLYTFAIRNQSPSNIQGDWLKYVEDHLISHNRFILVYNNVYIA